MTGLVNAARVVETKPRHADADEYDAFVGGLATGRVYRRRCNRFREHFVERYPDLEEWFAEPLHVRVGRDHRPAATRTFTDTTNAQALAYLLYLGLSGRVTFDWPWLFSVKLAKFWAYAERTGRVDAVAGRQALARESSGLGYLTWDGAEWALARHFLHTGDFDLRNVRAAHLSEIEAAIADFGSGPDGLAFHGSAARHRYIARSWHLSLHQLGVLLYHRGQAAEVPRIGGPPPWAVSHVLPAPMAALINRYVEARNLTDRPGTVEHTRIALCRFAAWLVDTEPGVSNFECVNRDHVVSYSGVLDAYRDPRRGRLLTISTKRWHLGALSGFFRDGARWEWEGMPAHRVMGAGDIPRMVKALPRYIPAEQLSPLMAAIRALECPYQRTALLIARWSGARRGEIARLELDCLDRYPDGTARLRIPAGKTMTERSVPIHEEAAEAIASIQRLRYEAPDRGLADELTGTVTRCLFVRYGQMMSTTYLFDSGMRIACIAAGLSGGATKITAHRFRHTVGTQLAERGAKLHTIMAMLGHTSADMSLVYAQISDREVLRDYQAVLGPGANIAGPSAAALRTGVMPASAVEWLKSNFFKTELELGHCLRLPEEGPCECDLYLTCAKFVTTPAYAPRLRRRRRLEIELAEDAQTKGWPREVQRHTCTADRIERLLCDLKEPLEGPDAEPLDRPAEVNPTESA
jgi:integrase